MRAIYQFEPELVGRDLAAVWAGLRSVGDENYTLAQGEQFTPHLKH